MHHTFGCVCGHGNRGFNGGCQKFLRDQGCGEDTPVCQHLLDVDVFGCKYVHADAQGSEAAAHTRTFHSARTQHRPIYLRSPSMHIPGAANHRSPGDTFNEKQALREPPPQTR